MADDSIRAAPASRAAPPRQSGNAPRARRAEARDIARAAVARAVLLRARMQRIITPAAFLTALLAGGAARAGTTPTTLTVDVDLTETAAKTSETLNATVTLAGPGACASLDSEDGTKLSVCRDGDDALSFDVRHGPRRLHVSSRLAPGRRTVVGKVTHGDEATELTATVR